MSLRLALLALALMTAEGTAAPSAENLVAAARAVEQSAPGRARRDALAAAVQVHEQVMAEVRAEVRELSLREGALQVVLNAQQDEIGALLAGLQQIPPPGTPPVLTHPDGALATARAAMTLAAATPPLQDRLTRLSANVRDLSQLRQEREALTRQLRSSATQARDLRARLIANYAHGGTAATSAEAMTIAAALREVATTLPRDDTPNQSGAPRDLPWPTEGTIQRQFSPDHPGIALAAPAGALITAPLPVTVRFAGHLEGFGGAVVLEPAPDALLILTGLGTILTQQDEVLSSGSPLGLMPLTAQSGDTPSQPNTIAANVNEAGGAARPDALYIETREARNPVDPLTWFEERKDTP